MNRVYKIIRNGDSTTFIIKTDGDNDFWFWTVYTSDIFDYFKKQGRNDLLLSYGLGHISKQGAEMFANDPCNDTLGCSCGGFDTVDDAINDILS